MTSFHLVQTYQHVSSCISSSSSPSPSVSYLRYSHHQVVVHLPLYKSGGGIISSISNSTIATSSTSTAQNNRPPPAA